MSKNITKTVIPADLAETIAESEEKALYLARFLNIDAEDVSEQRYDDCLFNADGAEYLVLTDEEADARAREYIEESLWAFTPHFLAGYCPEGVDSDVIKMLQDSGKCESLNDAFRGMVGSRFDDLVKDAIRYDGRAHFLNTYDGNEDEIRCDGSGSFDDGEYLYVYRTN